MLRFDEATFISLLFNFIFSQRLSSSLWGSDVLLFPEFINLISMMYHLLLLVRMLLTIFETFV